MPDVKSSKQNEKPFEIHTRRDHLGYTGKKIKKHRKYWYWRQRPWMMVTEALKPYKIKDIRSMLCF